MRAERVGPWIIFVLSISFLLQAILSVWDDSPTFDEMIGPSVGYVELVTGDLSFVHDHPPLYRLFNALPLLAFQPSIPMEHDSIQKRQKGMRDRYNFAHEFFYVANKDADRLLFWSRIPMVFLSLLLGLLVFKWARELYGNLAGLFALFLYSFEPNIIAHSRFTTNDLILALFLFSTIYQFWQYRNKPSSKALVLTGILFGLALISKFSAVILFPILFVLAFLGPNTTKSKDRAIDSILSLEKRTLIVSKISAASKTTFLVSIIAIGVALIFYGTQWNLYLKGFYDTLIHYQVGHPAFLMGDYSSNGWWIYFPVAFLLKTPIPLLIFIVVGLLFLSFRKEKAEYFLLVPLGIVSAAALFSHINIGIRHILPVYPFLIVFASSITTIHFSMPRSFLTGFACVALWYFFSTVSIFPSYLAYFNEFVGPKKGYLVLVDSNLDWGQDLKRLRVFMDQKGINQIYLSYFGTADPCYYGIKFRHLPSTLSDCGEKPNNQPPDFIAISAHHLQSVYFSDKKTFEWLKAYKPIEQIGYSIFVYDIKGDISAHNNLGILYLKYRMVNEALNEFKLVVELSPMKTIAHSNLGLAYAMLSMSAEAEEAFKKALILDPENSVAKEGLKKIHSKPSGG